MAQALREPGRFNAEGKGHGKPGAGYEIFHMSVNQIILLPTLHWLSKSQEHY